MFEYEDYLAEAKGAFEWATGDEPEIRAQKNSAYLDAIAAALIALVERLDRVTDKDNEAVRVVSLR